MDDFTRKFNIVMEKDAEIRHVLSTVYQALEEKGYNPINQIVGYILSEDPTYITNHNNARTLIRKIDRDELLQVLVKKGAGGLTTDDIYRAAKQLFEADHPENGGGAPGLVKPPAYKSLLFFFRRTANGNKSKHPLYDEILIDGCKNATTYTLECRWVESIAANGAAVD